MMLNDLLKVLDMSKDEQMEWLMDKNYIPSHYVTMRGQTPDESLANVAFRLRDEVKDLPNFVWSKAWHLVVAKVMYGYNWSMDELNKKFDEWTGTSKAVPNTTDREIFALYDSKPIHWIIAALIAKELEENKNDNKKMEISKL